MKKTSLAAAALLLLLAAASCRRTAGHTAGTVTADSGPGSLRDAVEGAADGGTITANRTGAGNVGFGVFGSPGTVPALHVCNSIIAGNSVAVQTGYCNITVAPTAEKLADLSPERIIAIPGDGMTTVAMITALQKDITDAFRPASGKVSYGARE